MLIKWQAIIWTNDVLAYWCICIYVSLSLGELTHWGRVMHICVSKLTLIDSDNGLSPERRQAIVWTNAGILLIGPWGTNFNEILIEIHTFSFKKMRLKVSSAKLRPSCLGLNVLRLVHLPQYFTHKSISILVGATSIFRRPNYVWGDFLRDILCCKLWPVYWLLLLSLCHVDTSLCLHIETLFITA